MPPIDTPPATEPSSPTPTGPASAPSGDNELLASVDTNDTGSDDDGLDIDFLASVKPAAEPAASPGASAAPTPAASAPGTPTPAAQPAAPATPAPVAQAPAAPPATPPAAQPPAQAAPSPAAPAAPAQAQPVQQPQGDPLAPYKKWRSDGESLLASTHFKLSPEQAEELAGDPAIAVPKLMARTYLDAVENSVQAMTNILPQFILAVTEQQRNHTQAEEKFFGQWPQLKEHRQTVEQIGQVWRAMNPKGSADDYIKQVGGQAIVALGLLNTLTQQGASAPQAAPQQSPFQPLGNGAPRVIGQPTQPTNMFEALSMESDD